ncbi:MAG: 23S rRNA (adenine(2030)-N(6))-methyltransferase RlmJ, partial [Pseudoclavibacter sp.]|nr:23S rRNA (adenine(2030)-N(6))-methyltransferase RlmJ [Pseudoclavibacter sp.]
MTRIIAGAARGAALTVPRRGTRPTSDRVREALFSAVEARMRLRGARVLDLYAGSGALGLEALSRGAAAAVLVERDPAAARVLRGNARSVTARLPDGAEARIVASGVERFLDGCRERFEAVFADPPYELAEPELARVLERLADGRL